MSSQKTCGTECFFDERVWFITVSDTTDTVMILATQKVTETRLTAVRERAATEP